MAGAFSRVLVAVYRPIARVVVRYRVVVVALAMLLMVATVPIFQRLGSEFMPPLDEGSLLISEEWRYGLQARLR